MNFPQVNNGKVVIRKLPLGYTENEVRMLAQKFHAHIVSVKCLPSLK